MTVLVISSEYEVKKKPKLQAGSGARVKIKPTIHVHTRPHTCAHIMYTSTKSCTYMDKMGFFLDWLQIITKCSGQHKGKSIYTYSSQWRSVTEIIRDYPKHLIFIINTAYICCCWKQSIFCHANILPNTGHQINVTKQLDLHLLFHCCLRVVL